VEELFDVEDLEMIKTGVRGLDDLLQEGIPKGWSVIVTGGPGSGKSSICVDFLCKGIENNDETVLLVLFEEPFRQVAATMKRIGLNLIEQLKNKKLVVIDASISPSKIKTDYPFLTWTKVGDAISENKRSVSISELHNVIQECIKYYKTSRIVIDSITAVKNYSDPHDFKFELTRLFKFLQDQKITTFLVAEKTENDTIPPEYYLAHGIIQIHIIKKKNEWIRAVEIQKMRGTDHKTKLAPMDIDKEGVTIFPDAPVFT